MIQKRSARYVLRWLFSTTALIALLGLSTTPALATHSTRRVPQGSGIPVRITLDDAFGENRVVVPPLTLGGTPVTTETRALKLRGYVDGSATISLLRGQVFIRLTSANLTVEPIVLDNSACPTLRTSPIAIRLDPTKSSTASADIFRGTSSLTLNALVRASLVADGTACGLGTVTTPYVERPISQTSTGGSFRLVIGIRDNRLMLGIVKGTATAPDVRLAGCLAEGPADSPCPPEGILELDPATLEVRMAAWVGLR